MSYLNEKIMSLYFKFLQDELLWAAAWLHKATKSSVYWDYLVQNMQNFKPQIEGSMLEFGWDAKHAGINVLVSKVLYKFSGDEEIWDDSCTNPLYDHVSLIVPSLICSTS